MGSLYDRGPIRGERTMINIPTILLLLFALSTSALCDEETVSNVGENKGVLEASHEKGFRLSQEAVKHLGIKTIEVEKKNRSLVLPRSALASVKREFFVYTLNGEFFKSIEVTATPTNPTTITPVHGAIQGRVAVEGVHFLRNIEVDVFSNEGGDHH